MCCKVESYFINSKFMAGEILGDDGVGKSATLPARVDVELSIDNRGNGEKGPDQVADTFVGNPFVEASITSVEDLAAGILRDHPGSDEGLVRDAVRTVAQRVVDGDESLLPRVDMGDGRTGAATESEGYGLKIKPRIDVDAVRRAVLRELGLEA
jgi:hypothetical protein